MDDFAAQVSGVGALAEPARRALYLYVVAQPGPVSRDQAAAGAGLPRHTAKFHLDKLVADGLLETEYRRMSGRRGPGAGRPTKLYRRSSRQVTAFTASAAPPRASPSSLVSTRPSRARRSAKALRDVHGVAAHQRVADQQRVGGPRRAADLLELAHQLVVDRQAAGGVVDDRRRSPRAGARSAAAAQIAGGASPSAPVWTGTPIRAAELLELEHRGRPVHVGGDQQRAAALALEVARELGRDRRLADALEPDQHHRRHAPRRRAPASGPRGPSARRAPPRRS